ncbi:3-oxoacyl-[acyl-carrier-protein] reductase FabG [Planctomycetes bacterium Poly30]|uniref:3-oxoacyl-[acyl-carrier-protein] reductase FabG n=2 Tax=Saltatorellus ferox TaxID=2528018 RepID=A0A518F0I2_9BACT|nr:3-oxoacyl-[acyl-carrier-protein] reductase FabG [Planctomycetes bacterium Poly30]
MALELGRRGTFIHALGRRSERLDELIAELPHGGLAHVVDVTDHAALRGAMGLADTHGASGPLDLVIANAGIAENGIESRDAADAAAQVLAVNAAAAAATLEFGKEFMRQRGVGHLCAISSLAGTRGLPGAPAYCASKAALSTYVEAMRFGLARTGLSITDVQPGFIKTPMTDRNRFPMPFLMEIEEATRRTVDALERTRPPSILRYPRRLAWPLRLAAGILPGWAWQRALGEK